MRFGNIVTVGLFVVMGTAFVGVLGLALLTKLRGPAEWVLVDANGTRIGDASFLDAGMFRHGLAPARSTSGWGYIDRDGNWVVPPEHAQAGEFDEAGYASVSPPDTPLFGLMDTTGQWSMEPEYLSFGPGASDNSVVGGERMG